MKSIILGFIVLISSTALGDTPTALELNQSRAYETKQRQIEDFLVAADARKSRTYNVYTAAQEKKKHDLQTVDRAKTASSVVIIDVDSKKRMATFISPSVAVTSVSAIAGSKEITYMGKRAYVQILFDREGENSFGLAFLEFEDVMSKSPAKTRKIAPKTSEILAASGKTAMFVSTLRNETTIFHDRETLQASSELGTGSLSNVQLTPDSILTFGKGGRKHTALYPSDVGAPLFVDGVLVGVLSDTLTLEEHSSRFVPVYAPKAYQAVDSLVSAPSEK